MLNEQITIEKDKKITSKYDWFNIEISGNRVGKIRSEIHADLMTIYSIYVFPEYEGQGIAHHIIDYFKNEYKSIVADRVRPSAIKFWQKMAFKKEQGGNYIWTR